MQKSGQISVHSENIFPIIRQWLYSDQDIFLRELVSNATDAIRKYQSLQTFGEAPATEEDWRIELRYHSGEKWLEIEDNGIGMSAEELDKYINQVAFSGALDFLEKYKDSTDGAGIIGHFGLGFYSVFMVAEHVRIESRSWQDQCPAVVWESEDGQAYQMREGNRGQRGTLIRVQLDQEAEKVFNAQKLREILHKYCQFMPYPIYFRDLVGEEEEAQRRAQRQEEAQRQYEERRKKAEDEGQDFTEEAPQALAAPESRPVNNCQPLWLKAPKDCSDEEYKKFYHEAFSDFREPLFWIHLNMDYPFALKGILYFPRYEHSYEQLEGRIKLYNNQVFVADNIKEVIPDFLFLLKGVLDCPDLPLNVSRSFLQNDAYVRKLSDHIVRKVADKLLGLFKKEREQYETYWPDIALFVKYGCLRDEKFYTRVQESLLFRTTEGACKTVEELGKDIYYVAQPEQQAVYVRACVEAGKTVCILDHELDSHFITYLERQQPELHFHRVDSLAQEGRGEEDWTEEEQALRARLETQLRELSGKQQLTLELRRGGLALPLMLQETEESRRMQEMQKQFLRMQGQGGDTELSSLFPVELRYLLDTESALYGKLREAAEGDQALLEQALGLAQLAHGSLKAEALADFVHKSFQRLAD